MITYLFNKLPGVRRLLSDLATARAKLEVEQAHLAHDRGALNAALHRESGLRDNLTDLRDKRSELQRRFDDLREIVVKQSASIEILTADRNRAERRIAELTVSTGEIVHREERFQRTIDTLNETLRARNIEFEDVCVQLAEAKAEQDRKSRPVLFRREPSLRDEELAAILAGKTSDRTIKAIEHLIDECAVQAMSEAATAPTVPILDGPHATCGFTQENRTFSAGGVYALTELKRRLAEALSPQRQDERKAA